MAATALLSRRVRLHRADAGTPIPRWAEWSSEALTFAAFGGLLHIALYIKERFAPEDEQDRHLQHRASADLTGHLSFREKSRKQHHVSHICYGTTDHLHILMGVATPATPPSTPVKPQPIRTDNQPHVVNISASKMSSVTRLLQPSQPDTALPEWLQPLSQHRALVIPPGTVQLHDTVLGRGSFGEVWLGKLGSSSVAVKLLDALQLRGEQGEQGVAEKGRAVVKEVGLVVGVGFGCLLAVVGQYCYVFQGVAGKRTTVDNWPTVNGLVSGQRSTFCVSQVNIMKDLRSANVVLFMGVCLSPLSIVTEYCSHGSLYDVIKRARDDPRGTDARRLTWARRVGMARDAAAVRGGNVGLPLCKATVPYDVMCTVMFFLRAWSQCAILVFYSISLLCYVDVYQCWLDVYQFCVNVYQFGVDFYPLHVPQGMVELHSRGVLHRCVCFGIPVKITSTLC